ncbi:DnaJ-domain-containing protein [Epithele typhae]|uniref:DnaJ-domain-containing protein n=1 Tax=Epithele typhae TaxID=378194 RepID=UPI002007903D|nr:DnaJ-domain-containing protein [Epithele typhae]KAH9935905.1 DnaJ-domain-containing protein [Epithele typhae]
MATTRNLYDILSVPQGASSDDVRKAYKFKVLETHPDKLPPGSDEATIAAAEAEFRDIRTAFDVLSDPAKRKAYDNGLNFVKRRVNVNPEDVQVRLARERAEWHKQAEARHQERMKVLHEEIGASQKRYQESLAQTELRYQEKMRTIEEQLTLHREVARAVAAGEPEGTYTLVDEMLSDLRRRCPEWEIRRQKVLKVSLETQLRRSKGLMSFTQQRVERVKEEAQAVQILAE